MEEMRNGEKEEKGSESEGWEREKEKEIENEKETLGSEGRKKNGDQVRDGILENKEGFWLVLWQKGNFSTAGESKVFCPLSVRFTLLFTRDFV